MHLKTELLRAFIDGELAAQRADQVEQHLSRCPSCRKQFEELQTRSRQVAMHLDLIAPRAEEEHRPPHLAFSRFFNSAHKSYSRKENIQTMLTRKPLWTALAVVAILAIALSLTPVQAWASSFLSLFRVEKITVIQFDPQAASEVNGKLSGLQETAANILEKDLKIIEGGEIQEVSSVEEAAAAAGFTPRIPAGMAGVKLAYQPGMQVRFNIEQPVLQAILDALEADVQLPEEVDGKEITASIPTAVIAASGCDPARSNADVPQSCTILVQLPSPTVDAPEGLDVKKIGAAMLQLLGLAPDEAAQLSQRIDWTSTMILPIPKDESIRVYDLAVDGVAGTLLVAENENSYTLLWVKDGILYALRGPGWATEAQSLVNTLP